MPKDPSAQTTIRSVPLDILRDQQCTQLSIYIYIVFTSSEPVNNVQIVYYIHIRRRNLIMVNEGPNFCKREAHQAS